MGREAIAILGVLQFSTGSDFAQQETFGNVWGLLVVMGGGSCWHLVDPAVGAATHPPMHSTVPATKITHPKGQQQCHVCSLTGDFSDQSLASLLLLPPI